MKQPRNLRTLAWPFAAIALAVLVTGLFIPRLGTAAGQAPVVTPDAASAPGADEQIVQGLRQALNSSRLNESDRQALKKKLEYSERLAEQRAAAPAGRGPKGSLTAPVPMPQPLAQPSGEPVERIIDGSEGTIHSWEASITNLWEGYYNATPYQVFAGSAVGHLEQGLLIVIKYSTDDGYPIRHIYQAPIASGALTIVERQNSRLRCAAADGSILFFDLETMSFQP